MKRAPYRENNIRVGYPDVDPSAPTHVRGVGSGNEPGNYERESGHLPGGCSTARRSTGINPASRNPILPSMPNLSPP